MHYYAIINEEYTVMEVTSSNTIINDDWYIEITEEQYNDEGFIGAFYDQDKNEFVGGVMWLGTTNEVRYDETYRTLTGKLNEMDEEIAAHTHTEYVSSSELQTLENDLQTLEGIVATKADSTHTHTIANITNLQNTLDGKQATITGGATTIASANLTSSRVLVSNSSGKVAVSTVTSTELGYLDGISSNVQTQLNDKAASSHNHSGVYADAGHSHTASAVGAVATTDVATVSEVETYLGI